MSSTSKTLKSLALGKSPHGETVVLRLNQELVSTVKFKQFCKLHSLNIYNTDIENVVILSTRNMRKDSAGKQYIYGGRAFHHATKQLIIGDEDMQRFDVNACKVRNDSGEFHLVEIDKDKVSMSADYFGLQNLFYYDHGDHQVVSTNYHLMLLLLKTVGATLELNFDKILEMLSENNVFGSGTAIEMKYCHVNDIDESIDVFSNSLDVVTDYEVHRQLHDDSTPFKRQEYDALITEARDEIVANVEMIFDYDGFDRVIVDLSGGLDSRVIYGATTAISQKKVREKIRINSQFGPSPNAKHGGDLEIAALVNSLFRYPMWDSYDSENVQQVDISDYENQDLFYVNKISRLFGTHKNFNHVVPKFVDYYPTNITRLSGFIGEVYRGANFKSSHGEKMSHINNYTNFRNRYMAARPFENILSPLASKKLLEASRMYQWNHEGSLSIAPEMDVLTAINPVFVLLPFYNEDLKDFLQTADTEELYNFPQNVTLDYSFVDEPKNTAVRSRETKNEYGRFVLDEGYSLSMLKAIEQYDSRFSDLIDVFRAKGPDIVKDRNARVLSMLWSVYFHIDIINGRGDF